MAIMYFTWFRFLNQRYYTLKLCYNYWLNLKLIITIYNTDNCLEVTYLFNFVRKNSVLRKKCTSMFRRLYKKWTNSKPRITSINARTQVAHDSDCTGVCLLLEETYIEEICLLLNGQLPEYYYGFRQPISWILSMKWWYVMCHLRCE